MGIDSNGREKTCGLGERGGFGSGATLEHHVEEGRAVGGACEEGGP
jgi:hypothetical protein